MVWVEFGGLVVVDLHGVGGVVGVILSRKLRSR